MLIYLVDGETLLCMPMDMIIVGPNQNKSKEAFAFKIRSLCECCEAYAFLLTSVTLILLRSSYKRFIYS